MAEWMSDKDRSRIARESLSRRAQELRKAAKDSRAAFLKDYMAVPARWTADVYDRAAEVLEAALAEIKSAKPLEAAGEERSAIDEEGDLVQSWMDRDRE
jgi:hypothetical protein